MARIVVDARESGTSTGRYVDKLIEYLHALAPPHEFVLLAKPHRVDFLSRTAPRFSIITTPYREFSWGEQLGLCWQIRTLRPDLVFFPMVQQPVLYRGTVVTTMQDLTTIRFRNPLRGRLNFALRIQVYKWLNRVVAAKSKRLITPTDFVRQDVARYCGIDPAKVTVTYESADRIEEPTQPIARLAGKRFILYVGRPAVHKNLARLIDAFELLRSRVPDLHLVLAGKTDGLYEQLQDNVRQRGLVQVDFTGFVNEGELRWLYEHTAAYVFPSLSEGFGLPGLEAIVHGAPLVCSQASCLPEVYRDAALYFDPSSAADMADKIEAVLSDAALAQQLIRDGHALSERYSWDRTARLTLGVFDDALAAG